MANVKIQQVKAASFLHGFGKKSRVSGTLSIPGFTFFSGETRNFEIITAIPAIEAATITLLKFNNVGNTNVNGKWLHLPGTTFFRNSAPSYDVQAIVSRQSDGLHILVQIYNPTFASNQTVPDLTMDFKTLLFDAPW